jgi:erythromycin esterase
LRPEDRLPRTGFTLRRALLALFAVLAVLVAALPALGAGPAAPTAPSAPSAQLDGDPAGPGLWHIRGTDPSLPQDDLAPLRALIGDATVVGLGESIHTSGGFYQLKHRVIRDLVEHAGFRLLTFETGWYGGDRVEAYLQKCAGSPEGPMEGIYGIWRSAEVRDLLTWMCQWNKSHKRPADRLHFMGFDIQSDLGQTKVNAVALRAFLKRIGVPPTDPRSVDLERCDGVGVSEPFGQIRTEDYIPCAAALRAVDQLFTRDAAKIQRRTSKKDFAWAKLHRLGMAAWEDASYNLHRGGNGYSNARDFGMAATFLGLRELRFPKAKAIVWAHNDHIAESDHDPRTPEVRLMGQHLVAALGPSYFTVSFGAKVTEIDWELACGPAPHYGDDPSVEHSLHQLGLGDLLVDLKTSNTIPGGVQLLGDTQVIASEQWDALLYLERSPKMSPLAWPSCQ